MLFDREIIPQKEVAPLAGAWIEMVLISQGRKSGGVAPLAGAWIEIAGEPQNHEHDRSRSPRGSVD